MTAECRDVSAVEGEELVWNPVSYHWRIKSMNAAGIKAAAKCPAMVSLWTKWLKCSFSTVAYIAQLLQHYILYQEKHYLRLN